MNFPFGARHIVRGRFDLGRVRITNKWHKFSHRSYWKQQQTFALIVHHHSVLQEFIWYCTNQGWHWTDHQPYTWKLHGAIDANATKVALDSDLTSDKINESEIAPRIQAGWDKMCCLPKMFLRVFQNFQKALIDSMEPKADMFHSCVYLWNLHVIDNIHVNGDSKVWIQHVPKQ